MVEDFFRFSLVRFICILGQPCVRVCNIS